MRILVLGADGYLGWPTCMYFSQKNHEVLGIDNYLRRNITRDLNAEAVIPTPNLNKRAELWEKLTNKEIEIVIGDITNYSVLYETVKRFKPTTIIHYAEQPSGPWSMISRENAALTIQNNLISTLNVAYVVKELDLNCHIVKLGTAGEWGTPNTDIPEGWFEFEFNGRKDLRLFPREAGSLYHTTKIMDTDMLWFYVRVWRLKVTDLMQGPVYGIITDEMTQQNNLVPELITNFNWDECMGTVLNRFIVQALLNYPLTVYGKGDQIRGFLNIKDTMQCVYLSAMNPPERGQLEVYNQMTETFSVNQLAEKVQKVAKDKFNINVQIQHLKNPRVEKESHYYNPIYTKLLDLGLKPNYLTNDDIFTMMSLIQPFVHKINKSAIFKGYNWR